VIITGERQLRQLVKEYQQHDALVFDLETMYVATEEEQAESDRIHERPQHQWSADEKAWINVFDLKATDPHINTTIWFGMATAGRSDAIAVGHPKGELIEPAHKIKTTAADYYGVGDDRAYTPTGRLSSRAMEVLVPARFEPPPPQLTLEQACEILRPLFFDEGRRIVNQNLKFDIKSLVRAYDGEFIPGPYGDTIVAQHTVDENAFMSLNLGAMVERHFGHSYDKLGSKGVHNFSFNAAARYAEQDAKFTWLLWKRYERILKREGLFDLFEFKMQVMEMLMRKEWAGAYVDSKAMEITRQTYEKRKRDTVARLLSEHSVPPTFNPDSTLHKADLLFTRLKAPVLKRTGTGKASVDAETLEKVAQMPGEAGQAAQTLLDYAEVSKVIGTYFVGMGAKLDGAGFLHPDFTQHAADTGRLACRTPNLHNIPRESDMRDMFTAPKGYVVVGADYDQIELRFICAESQDTTMQEVFLSGEDVHATTAALVLNKPLDEVTKDERSNFGKMPNFLIGYGGTAFLLAAKTGITVDEADAVFKAYFSRFSRINPWKEEVIAEAVARATWKDGNLIVPPYVTTMMGQRRRLPDLLRKTNRNMSKEEWRETMKLRSRAERQAVNAVTQGSAAETLQIAMLDIDRYCRERKFPMRLAINIHDEVVAYCKESHAEEGQLIVESLMGDVVNPFTGEPPLRDFVPLIASGYIADRWRKV